MTAPLRPVGYFVHHQGRGHAERAAALAGELVRHRPVELFCARPDIFPPLPAGVGVTRLPSLFEPREDASLALAGADTPDTLHCAPLDWPQITEAVATLASWFATARPALFITDVSAELAQLARIASVPTCPVVQHGRRDDPGHLAAYTGAACLLAPYHRRIDNSGHAPHLRAKTIFAPGIGVAPPPQIDKAAARQALGLDPARELVVVLGGAGGTGLPTAPLTLGARAEPDVQWVTLGPVQSEWHETPPANLVHKGWVDDPERWIAAADRVVSTAGNTTVHTVAAIGRPWVVVPEWRYFAEQLRKGEALGKAGAAAYAPHWPSDAGEWRALWQKARALDPADQQALYDRHAAAHAADALEEVITRLGTGGASPAAPLPVRLEAVR